MGGRYVALVLLILAACSSAPAGAKSPASATQSGIASSARSQNSPSPSPSPSPTTAPVQASLLAMVNTTQTQQTISLVDRNGHVAASTTSPIADLEPVPFPGTATARLTTGAYGIGGVCCGVFLPEVNTTNRRVYFVSGLDDLRYLDIDGSTGHAAQLPNVKGRSQAVYAISPDDRRIAVSVFDWSQHPMTVTIYVESLGGGHRVDIFSSSSIYEWPAAWHGGSLVVAVCCILGSASNPYAAVSYHVADPNTGQRLAQLGSPACQVIGPLVEAGTLCSSVCTGGDVHNVPPGAQACLDGVDWSGKQRVMYRYIDPNGIGTWAALAPDGGSVALQEPGPPLGHFVVRADGSRVDLPSVDSPVAWWLDGDTLSMFGLPAQGINAFLYRISSAQVIPLPDNLGFVQGVVPGS